MSKFNSAIDEYAYNLSLEGCDEQAGDVSECGWWARLLRGVGEPAATARIELELSDEDCALARDCAGCIVSEDNDGFVTVEWFNADEARALETNWKVYVDAEREGITPWKPTI